MNLEKNKSQALALWSGFALVFLWVLYRAFSGNGWALDDELAHFRISRSVWDDPEQILHLWSRPGRNLLEFWPSLFGLKATRVWVLLLAMLAIWLSVAEGKRLKMRSLWALPLLIGFQCWFPELAASVLTQTPFMLVWIAGVYLAARGHLVSAALCWGSLGLIRHEGIALSALWGLWVVLGPQGFLRLAWQKNWPQSSRAFGQAAWLGFWTFFPNIVFNVAARLSTGKWPFLIFLDEKPTSLYGSGNLFHFFPLIVIGAGFPVMTLAILGFRKLRFTTWENVLYLTYPAYFLLHSIIFWRGLFASGGYYHFLMPMAPWLGLVALRGLERLSQKWKIAAMATVVFLGFLLPQEQLNPRDEHIEGMPDSPVMERIKALRFPAPPTSLSHYQLGLREAAAFLDSSLENEQAWLAPNEIITFFRSKKTGARQEPTHFTAEAKKADLPAGTLVVWDALYSPQEAYGWDLAIFKKSQWLEISRYAHGSVRIFKKLPAE